MSDRCDGCGAVIERETLAYDIDGLSRVVGGDFIDYSGTRREWDHADLYGDLCSKCATPVIEVLNAVLNGDGGDE